MHNEYMAKNSIQRYYGNDRAAKVIYGTILIFAYPITQSHNDETSSLTLVTGTFFAAVAIVVAEIYAEILGKTIRNQKKLSKHERLEIQKDSLAIVSVSFWPSFLFFLSHFGLFSVQSVFKLSYLLLLTILVIFSYWSARLSNYSKGGSIVISATVSCIGLLVIILKYTLGH